MYMYIHVKCTIHLFTLQFKWYKWSTGTGTSNYLSNKCCLWWFIQIKRGSKLCIKNELYNIFAAIKAFIVYIYICLLKFSYITVELPLFVFAQFLWIFFWIPLTQELTSFKHLIFEVIVSFLVLWNVYVRSKSFLKVQRKNPCKKTLFFTHSILFLLLYKGVILDVYWYVLKMLPIFNLYQYSVRE